MLTVLFLTGGVFLFTEAVKTQLKKRKTDAKSLAFALVGSALIGLGLYFL